jgi:broad specificity phosphatase PhoE
VTEARSGSELDTQAGGGGAVGPARPRVWVLRHGDTDWADAGRHTGRTDLPLNAAGRAEAEALGRLLEGQRFSRVLVSPLGRARTTCQLAGFGSQAEVCDDLLEFDYGDYEGLTTEQIRQQVPGWTIWTGACPGGETLDEVATRADRVIAEVLADSPRPATSSGDDRREPDVALFAHGHILRVLAARWCELSPVEGRRFALDTATLSTLGWEHEYRTIRRWNARQLS